jgi:hypothetical protein
MASSFQPERMFSAWISATPPAEGGGGTVTLRPPSNSA